MQRDLYTIECYLNLAYAKSPLPIEELSSASLHEVLLGAEVHFRRGVITRYEGSLSLPNLICRMSTYNP
jgi:hypothetical protein